MGAERGVSIAPHMQSLVTNIFQRHWEWHGRPQDRFATMRCYRWNTAFVASLDVKPGFRRGNKASVVSKILTLIAAALLAQVQHGSRLVLCQESNQRDWKALCKSA